MKGLVILVVLAIVALVVGAWVMNSQYGGEPPVLVGLAFGNPSTENVEMHVVVGMGYERPRRDPLTGAQLWDEWFDEHYDLRADSGERVSLRRANNSPFITERDAGYPEFFLIAVLRQGVNYTFDFTPRVAEGTPHRFTFTAPSESVPFARRRFEPVED